MTNENIIAAVNGTLAYQFDDVGNLLSRSSGASLPNQALTYNNNDWLSTDSYDSNGGCLMAQ